jgi:hypothetical protein
MAICCPEIWGIAMKASSLFVAGLAVAISSIAPANAQKLKAATTLATTSGNCSTTTWPNVSAVQCTKPYAHNYVECTEMVGKTGSKPSDAWWWCSNQGFKD